VDDEGNILGFSIIKVSALKKALEVAPLSDTYATFVLILTRGDFELTRDQAA